MATLPSFAAARKLNLVSVLMAAHNRRCARHGMSSRRCRLPGTRAVRPKQLERWRALQPRVPAEQGSNLASEWIPRWSVSELQVTEISAKSQTDT